MNKLPEAMPTPKHATPASATAVTARPEVVATMNAYLEAAADAVCNRNFDLDVLGVLGLDESVSADAQAAMVAQLIAAYVQGAVALHVAHGVGCATSPSQSLEVKP